MFYKNLDDIAAKIITYNTNHSKGTLRFLVEYNNFIQQLTEKDKRGKLTSQSAELITKNNKKVYYYVD